MREPHVWIWIVKQEKLSIVTELYENTIKFEYSIYHSTYVPAKTEGIMAINEARGNKQVGAVSLIFLTYNALSHGRASVKTSNTFKKIYNIPHPLQGTAIGALYTVFPALELRLEFYVFVLQSLAISGRRCTTCLEAASSCTWPW